MIHIATILDWQAFKARWGQAKHAARVRASMPACVQNRDATRERARRYVGRVYGIRVGRLGGWDGCPGVRPWDGQIDKV